MNTWRPDAYHGHNRAEGYFEGWYFKLVDAHQQQSLAIIPGVFLGAHGIDSHAFIQVLNGNTGETTYHRFPLQEFWAARNRFDIRIGNNRFTNSQIELTLDRPSPRLVGLLRFNHLTRWPVTWRSPGIMDWYAFTPFMECYHGIVSLNHDVTGLIVVDGVPLDFHGGRGYTEKDWGRAFPSAWVWMQTNHFDTPHACLTASIARIPWLGSAFRGFIIGLWHNGTLYRFATYTGAKTVRLEVTENRVVWDVTGPLSINGKRVLARLQLVAHRDDQRVEPLHAPQRTAMVQRVHESLTAVIDVCLSVDVGGAETVLFHASGKHAGLEVGGRIEEILR